MHFTKMHGLGNDYLYVFGEVPENAPELSIALSKRHFGAGSDGMIWITPSSVADFAMRIFNADGSEAKMCGNGIRCVGKYVYDKGYTDQTRLRIETQSGIRELFLEVAQARVQTVSVNMGRAACEAPQSLRVGDKAHTYTAVSVGNPHAVFFVDNAEAVPLAEIGPQVERHPAFPGGVNAEFVQVIGTNELRMRVWERGSGITMACGTGACASAAAAVAEGLCSRNVPITVRLDGGDLTVQIADDNSVVMTGAAEFVYEGETDICLRQM